MVRQVEVTHLMYAFEVIGEARTSMIFPMDPQKQGVP